MSRIIGVREGKDIGMSSKGMTLLNVDAFEGKKKCYSKP